MVWVEISYVSIRMNLGLYRGRMWRVIKNMYDITQSAVLLEGEVSEQFNIGQGWHRVVVCRLSSFPFY